MTRITQVGLDYFDLVHGCMDATFLHIRPGVELLTARQRVADVMSPNPSVPAIRNGADARRNRSD